MQKITAEVVERYLKDNIFELYPTQSRLCIPIINRIYQKMINNLKFDDIKVCENLVIDGHHRYISSLLAKKPLATLPTSKTSATKKYSWLEVKFVNEEWDTHQKIERLNSDDALFNNISLEEINKLIS